MKPMPRPLLLSLLAEDNFSTARSCNPEGGRRPVLRSGCGREEVGNAPEAKMQEARAAAAPSPATMSSVTRSGRSVRGLLSRPRPMWARRSQAIAYAIRSSVPPPSQAGAVYTHLAAGPRSSAAHVGCLQGIRVSDQRCGRRRHNGALRQERKVGKLQVFLSNAHQQSNRRDVQAQREGISAG
jgi:hypothetical protein